MEDVVAANEDLDNCTAFVHLRQLAEDGKLSQERLQYYQDMYQRLHEAMLSTYSNEACLLSTAKVLNETYLKRKSGLEKQMEQMNDVEESVRQLRKELEVSTDELKEVKDYSHLVRFEMEELEQANHEKERSIDERREAHMALIQPDINKLMAERDEIKKEIEANRVAYEKEKTATRDYREQMAPLRESCRQSDKEKHQLRHKLDKMSGDPGAMRAKVAMLEKAKLRVEQEAANIGKDIEAKEADIAVIHEDRHHLEDERYNMEYKLEMLNTALAKGQTDVDELKRTLDEEADVSAQYKEEFSKIEWQKAQSKRAYREEHYVLGALHKELERLKRKYEKLRRKGETIRDILGPLKRQHAAIQEEKAELGVRLHEESRGFDTFKEDEELFISQLLKQENFEENTLKVLGQIRSETAALEEKIECVQREERALKHTITELELSRTQTARLASQATMAARETRNLLKTKDLVVLDLEKQLNHTKEMLQSCSQLYKVMKNQRNKFANTSQSVTQAIAEMREKIKILSNEVAILRDEATSRDAALREEVRQHQTSKTVRDGLRVENNKLVHEIRERKTEHESQVIEVEKLNGLISRTEEEMIALRKKYAHAVDSHNLTGIQLIDRNDELCILYEKSHIHDNILKKGKVSLLTLEQRVGVMQLQIDELERQREARLRKIPSPAEYENARKALENLERELREEEKLAKTLSQQLESPVITPIDLSGANAAEVNRFIENLDKNEARQRQRKLDGIDPDPQQMKVKLDLLHERLNEKKEQLLEKELLLDEVTSLTTKLSLQAAENRQSTLTLAKRVNEYQSKIRNTTNKMMAVVSELSMYQAKAMKLEQEKNAKEQLLQEATQRHRDGMPPTDEAELEWYRQQRDRVNRERAMISRNQQRQRKQQQQLYYSTGGMDGANHQNTRTTAEQRPNAYIPDDIGIPKPYIMPPFKPTAAGANMRHIRKPQLREIEL